MVANIKELIRELDSDELKNLDRYSSATTLTVIELEIYPELIQAQLLANLMSPSLWEWKEKLPKKTGSPIRRKVEAIKQYIIQNYNFTHMEEYPGLCPCGTTAIEDEQKRFPDSIRKTKLFRNLHEIFIDGKNSSLAELLGVSDVREFYHFSCCPPGTIPIWGNETVEKMDAYRRISQDQKASGKCEALAALYAAALISVGDFPIEYVYMLFTPAHVMTYLMEGNGYLSSNRRMFSPISLRNVSPHTNVVRSCFENEGIVRIQNMCGYVDDLEEKSTIPKENLEGLYHHLEKYAQEANVKKPTLPQISEKRFIPAHETPKDRLKDAIEWQDYVREMSDKFPNSVYDLARYVFRKIDVAYPEAYALVAKQRNPHSKQKAKELKGKEGIIRYVQDEMTHQHDSIFGDDRRLTLPDETLIFGVGNHRDRALALYAMLSHVSEEPYIIFGERNSYVWHDKIIPVTNYDKSERVLNIFNSHSHGAFSDSVPRIGDL